MKYGVCITHYGRHVPVSELLEAVRETEKLGFDSIWVTDHVMIPEGVRPAQFIREHMLAPRQSLQGRPFVRQTASSG